MSSRWGLVWHECISGYLRVFSRGDWVKTLLPPKTLCDTTIPFLINTLHKFICLVGRDKSTTKKIQLSQHAKYDRSNPNKNTVLHSCHKQQYLNILMSPQFHCYIYWISSLPCTVTNWIQLYITHMPFHGIFVTGLRNVLYHIWTINVYVM
jgi:hypothetical protein